jgi:antagonist of KipI
LRLGNALIGNQKDAPALEMTLSGGTFEFDQAAVIALAGADFGAAFDGCDIAPWRAQEISAGATLRIGMTRSGARSYLCVRGGIQVESLLGSASTHVLSSLGGFRGRALKKGDRLQIAPANTGAPLRGIQPDVLRLLAPRKILRVTWGPQCDRFEDESRRALLSQAYTLTEEANRMGLRLSGPPIGTPHGGQMITEGVSLGAIQVPAAGQPIILFVDQQTTGGYPIIANVISADLPSLGQLRPRDEIRFELVSFDEARRLIIEQERLLAL